MSPAKSATSVTHYCINHKSVADCIIGRHVWNVVEDSGAACDVRLVRRNVGHLPFSAKVAGAIKVPLNSRGHILSDLYIFF